MIAGRLERVLVRRPLREDVGSWERLRWLAAPDPTRMDVEHGRLRALLADAGAEVVEAEGEPGNLDAIYVFDPVLVTPAGVILLRPGKAERRGEPDALARDLDRLGVPVIGRLEEPALAEGGDTLWLDERTLAVGRSYRTNDAGVDVVVYEGAEISHKGHGGPTCLTLPLPVDFARSRSS